MPAFPQLTSGAMAQMPLRRTLRYRTRRNDLRDGSMLPLADTDFEERSWELALRELTGGEWQALEELFSAVEGRLGTFTFLDPAANLLAWSERLTLAPWAVTGAALDAQADALEGTRGSRLNAGSTASQTIAAPSDYRYAASAWLRTSGAGAKLRASDGAAQAFEVDVEPSGQWKRYVLRYEGTSSTGAVRLELAAGGAPLDVYGPQLEAQMWASPYKVSTAQGGVFAHTRFDQDVLTRETNGPDRHDTRVRLTWTPSQL